MDTRQESVAPSTLDSDMIHKKPECITKGEPIWEAAPPAGHDTPAEKPPAEMNICNTPDNLQMSGMLLKMADGSPPAEVTILTDPDILQKELSVMTVTSKRWMERFVMNPQVLCLDGLTSNYDPEDRCSNVDGEEGVFQDLILEVVSV